MRLIRLLIVSLSAVILLTGCWNNREITELAIITAIGIDRADDPSQYVLSFQVVNPTEISSVSGGPAGLETTTTVYTSKGSSIFEAIRSASKKVPRQLFFSHVRLVVLGEEVAREGINEVFDFFERSHETRMTANMLIARNGKAQDIISAVVPLEPIQANAAIGEMKRTTKVWSHNLDWQIDDIIRDLISPGKNPTLNGIRIQGDQSMETKKSNLETTRPAATMEISGIGLFKNEKLVRWIDGNKARGLVRLNNQMNSTITMLDCEERKNGVSIETLRSKTKITVKLVSGKPHFRVHVVEEGVISEMTCKLPIDRPDTIGMLQAKWNQSIKDEMRAIVEETQKRQMDSIGFGLVLSRKYPKAWNTLKVDWDRKYASAVVDYSVDSAILRTGMRSTTFLKIENK
ncbi:Ger(x)C family spore germination protein [Paenibacillus sp. R14(2021)]|uniref:Ger(x)C family spore germination protein n=1 Tax=Paenibacillus sp. R14(2021) TaxID=2859228 RepID=UPI001C6146CF|nr:Ger(x)C family spore germination protein [Paenibacillus sp. R14(2021)]